MLFVLDWNGGIVICRLEREKKSRKRLGKSQSELSPAETSGRVMADEHSRRQEMDIKILRNGDERDIGVERENPQAFKYQTTDCQEKPFLLF